MRPDLRGIQWLLRSSVNLRTHATALRLLHHIRHGVPSNICKMRPVSQRRNKDGLPVAALSFLIIAMSDVQDAPEASNTQAPNIGTRLHPVGGERMWALEL